VVGGVGGEEEEWRQGKDGNDDLSPFSLLFFACQIPERTCKKKTNLQTDQKHRPTEIFFLSAKFISTVGILNLGPGSEPKIKKAALFNRDN
jgi:hypothetical protein